MTLESYFILLWVLVMLHVALGNYLYLRKVLPALRSDTGDASPRFLPSAQSRQVKDYLRMLERERTKPWFYFFLKHQGVITALLALAMVPIFLKLLGVY